MKLALLHLLVCISIQIFLFNDPSKRFLYPLAGPLQVLPDHFVLYPTNSKELLQDSILLIDPMQLSVLDLHKSLFPLTALSLRLLDLSLFNIDYLPDVENVLYAAEHVADNLLRILDSLLASCGDA